MAASAENGMLVYLANGDAVVQNNLQLTWLDRSGLELGKVGPSGGVQGVALSPDEKTVAIPRLVPVSQAYEIWLHDLARETESRLTLRASGSSRAPVWSPERGRIIFSAIRPGNAVADVYSKEIDGGQEELLLHNGNEKNPSDWSRDGRYLVYTEVDPKNRGDIWLLRDPLGNAGDRKPVPFLRTEFNESNGQIAPDGHWIAYTSDESGQEEVYVRSFPFGDGKWQVSTKRGREPRWRLDGKELFYLEGQVPRHRLMVVAITAGPRLAFGPPKPLFEFRSQAVILERNGFLYSPSADGQHFLVNVSTADARPTLEVLVNWQKAIGAAYK
jgi:eukaryotic-like serine/threonine-protein kinase